MPSDSRSRRFSLKEACLLLIPCAILAGMALALRNRNGSTIDLSDPNKFQLYVEKHEFEPVTPREVSQGYSAKLKLTLNHTGPTPEWWGTLLSGMPNDYRSQFAYKVSSSLQPIRDRRIFERLIQPATYEAESNRYIIRFLLPLSQIPRKDADVVWQAKVPIYGGLQSSLTRIKSSACPIEIVVRKSGEAPPLPKVSTKSDLVLSRSEVGLMSPIEKKRNSKYHANDTKIHIYTRHTGQSFKYNEGSAWDVLSTKIIDRSGKEVARAIFDGYGGDDSKAGTCGMRFYTSLATIPLGIGPLFIETKISFREQWPLTVRIPVRDRSGRIIITNPRIKQANLTIVKTSVSPASSEFKEYGCDTQVTIDLKYAGASLDSDAPNAGWEFFWSEHLEDEHGQKYWDLKYIHPRKTRWYVGSHVLKKNGVFGMCARLLPRRGRIDTIQYAFPLNQIPLSAGRVWLKAEIAAGNNAFLPVKVLVRDTPLTKTQKSAGERSPAL